MPRLARTVFATLLASLTSLAAAHASVVTDFATGIDGWSVTGDNASVWSATGGNPAGCLFVNDLATGDNNRSVAPARYLGDWTGAGAGDSLRVDVWLVRLSGTEGPAPWLFRIEGPGGAAHARLDVLPPLGVWTRYAVSMAAADWVMETGTWTALLANVTSLVIQSEFVNGDEDCRLDNVVLTRDPVRVFNPCVVETFNSPGLGAWSFQNTGGTTNPGVGGNSLGFCQVADASGVAGVAFAPPAFHGDWSALDGTGRVSVDVRVVSAAGNAGATEFLRLSGPGGTASVSLAPGDLPPAPRMWKRFSFPVRSAAWTVTSGTWAGLLADVRELRIAVEFFDNTDVIGIDNVARLSAACPDPDTRIHVLPVGPWVCDVIPMAGVQSVAFDASTGRLGGIVDTTLAAGGGLWAVQGSGAGTLLQGYAAPTHVIYDPAGNAYVSDDATGVVFRRAAAGGSSTWVAGFHAGDDDPAGMCLAPPGFVGANVAPGDVLVTDWGFSGPDEIWAFSTSVAEGERLVMPDPGETDIQDVSPGPGGRVWFADALDPDSLFSIDGNGVRSGIRLSTPVPYATSIVWDPVPGHGWLYLASRDAGALFRADPTTGSVERVADGFVFLDLCCLEIDVEGRRLWIADEGAGRVFQFCLPMSVTDAPSRAVTGGLRLAAGPNPSAGSTRVTFTLPGASAARVEVFDALGRRVRTLLDARLPAGTHALEWDGAADDGTRAAPGVYVLRAAAGGDSGAARVVRTR